MTIATSTYPYSAVRRGNLSPRQQEVLRLVCEDLGNKQIAEKLRITKGTVSKHRESLSKFSKTHTPIGLYKWAIAHGYVQPPPLADK